MTQWIWFSTSRLRRVECPRGKGGILKKRWAIRCKWEWFLSVWSEYIRYSPEVYDFFHITEPNATKGFSKWINLALINFKRWRPIIRGLCTSTLVHLGIDRPYARPSISQAFEIHFNSSLFLSNAQCKWRKSSGPFLLVSTVPSWFPRFLVSKLKIQSFENIPRARGVKILLT